MITLITGQPGAGKTLYSLCRIKTEAEREARTVYYNGINECKLPWVLLDDPEKWHELPTGAIIVIDECQRVFRPRAFSGAVPKYVSELETHRHKGFDIYLTTQHPMLVDTNIRRLIGKHFHVQRSFGRQKAVIHEFQNLKDNPDKNRADSIRHDFGFPKEAFGWYKSAEQHTHKRNIPMRLWFLLAVPILLAGIVYGLYSTWFGPKIFGSKPKEEVAKVLAATTPSAGVPTAIPASSSAPKAISPGDYADARQPRVAGLAYTAPIYDELTKPQRVPTPSACGRIGARCSCFTNQATALDMPDAICNQIVNRGYFDEFGDQARPEARLQPVQTQVVATPEPERQIPAVAMIEAPQKQNDSRPFLSVREPRQERQSGG